ncbi:DUF3800 domain-containing protein [Chitinophaga lutea]|uniref:DUF3800 domain-containing protein n=1 Tax=Chitinophaga lutea TaxID=2488634 RepID=A0A3N4Q1Y4_9BACT|nr:DUF3800 domain-containing protein [Chitinophaga lutea]RPE09970.1 DUF3800 domain-containing protein [Chitinophaga lutea]
MAYFLFIDESGQDHKNSPYEVLAGIAIQDTLLWQLIKDVHDIELNCFGRRYRHDGREIKATKFLNTKTFRLAGQMAPINMPERTALAKLALDNGESTNKKQLTALAQAKLSYVKQIFRLCYGYRCRIFAAIIANPDKVLADASMLRKDYVYLFERFYYFLEDAPGASQGIVVFDELDKSSSHILLNQMEKYFKNTMKGRARSNLIIPEPFFVHSDLTTSIQIVDFIAYLFSWNFRVPKLTKPGRTELNSYIEMLKPMRYKTTRVIGENNNHIIWSVTPV